MKLLLSLALFMSLGAHAASMNLHCTSSLNSTPLFQLNVTLEEGQRNLLIAKTDLYRYFLSSQGDDVVELQVYDVSEPSRSYALGKMKEKNFIEMVVWKRDTLLETRCSLLN